MDNGEVINGLNEGWAFLGANLMEWMSGFLMMLFIGSAFHLNPVASTPIFVLILVFITFGMASLRKGCPDGTRGVANLFMVFLGVPPPGIPRPSAIQPFWSGAPIKTIAAKKDYAHLDLDEMFEVIYEEKYGDK